MDRSVLHNLFHLFRNSFDYAASQLALQRKTENTTIIMIDEMDTPVVQ